VTILHQRNENCSIARPVVAPNSISVTVKTRNVGGSKSGGIWFRIDRTERQTQSSRTPRQAPPQMLLWGQSITQTCSASWTVTLDKLDGTPPQQYSQPTQNSSISIAYTGAGVQITMPTLQNVSF
jgi:hypothetical protein